MGHSARPAHPYRQRRHGRAPEPDERARARIPGSKHMPMSQLHEAELAMHEGRPVLFHCRSGSLTAAVRPAVFRA